MNLGGELDRARVLRKLIQYSLGLGEEEPLVKDLFGPYGSLDFSCISEILNSLNLHIKSISRRENQTRGDQWFWRGSIDWKIDSPSLPYKTRKSRKL